MLIGLYFCLSCLQYSSVLISQFQLFDRWLHTDYVDYLCTRLPVMFYQPSFPTIGRTYRFNTNVEANQW